MSSAVQQVVMTLTMEVKKLAPKGTFVHAKCNY